MAVVNCLVNRNSPLIGKIRIIMPRDLFGLIVGEFQAVRMAKVVPSSLQLQESAVMDLVGTLGKIGQQSRGIEQKRDAQRGVEIGSQIIVCRCACRGNVPWGHVEIVEVQRQKTLRFGRARRRQRLARWAIVED